MQGRQGEGQGTIPLSPTFQLSPIPEDLTQKPLRDDREDKLSPGIRENFTRPIAASGAPQEPLWAISCQPCLLNLSLQSRISDHP